jgi:hypothetical protein
VFFWSSILFSSQFLNFKRFDFLDAEVSTVDFAALAVSVHGFALAAAQQAQGRLRLSPVGMPVTLHVLDHGMVGDISCHSIHRPSTGFLTCAGFVRRDGLHGNVRAVLVAQYLGKSICKQRRVQAF